SPGEENEDVLFSLASSSIQFIPTRHEQGAAFMADVWGRLTGKAGVCLATLGPGATNLVTGIADATLDKSPLVAITGQAGLMRTNRESHQYLDVKNMLAPITKWNASIRHPDMIPEMVRKAFKSAQEEKPGAAHLARPIEPRGIGHGIVASDAADRHPQPILHLPSRARGITQQLAAARVVDEEC
ncbi:MAG: acetolactate synthase large subunit, partial [Rhodospirillales bacterium]|nr:acetolactate synthase large subunit [Rhodospirillales bacterium]